MNYNNDAQDSLRPRTLQFPQLLHNSFCSIWFDIYFVSDLINFLQKSRSLLLSSKGHTIVLKIEPRSDVTSAQLFIGPASSTAYTIRAIAKYHGSRNASRWVRSTTPTSWPWGTKTNGKTSVFASIFSTFSTLILHRARLVVFVRDVRSLKILSMEVSWLKTEGPVLYASWPLLTR